MLNDIERKQTTFSPDPDATVDLGQDYSAKRSLNNESALDRLLNDSHLANADTMFPSKAEAAEAAPAQKPVPSAIREAQDPTPAKRGIVKDVAVSTVGAGRDFLQNTQDGIQAVLDWSITNSPITSAIKMVAPEQTQKFIDDILTPHEGADVELPQVSSPQTVAGALTRGIGSFLLGFIPAAKAFGVAGAVSKVKTVGTTAAKVNAFARTAGASGVADFFVFDAQGERLSNLIQEVPILNNPVSEYLAADIEDGEIEGRLKNVLEGAGLDAAMAGAFLGSLKAIRGMRKAKAAPVEELAKAGKAAKAAEDLPPEDILSTKKPLVSKAKPKKPLTETRKGKKVVSEIEEAEKIFDAKAPLDLNVTVREGDKALNINLANMNTTDDIDKVLKATSENFSESIKKGTRGKMTHEATEQLADDLGMTTAELLGRKSGEAFNAEKALASRNLLLSSAEKLQEMAVKIRSAEATDKDFYIFRKMMIQHAAIQKQVSGLTAEAGRLLQSFRIEASSQKEMLGQLDDILMRTGGRGSAKDMAQAILESGSLGNVNKIVSKAHRANTFDMIYEGWLNSILSGARTHAVNILSTYTNVALQVPDRVFASVYGKIFRTADGVRMGEAFHHAWGMVQGIGDGLKMAKTAFDTEGLVDPLSKIELPNRQAITAQQVAQTHLGKTANKGLKALGMETLENGGVAANFVDFVGTATRFPGFRMLATEDAFFKGMNYRMEVNALATRTAMNEGLTGRALGMRINELMQKPSAGIRTEAMEKAAVNTFTDRNKVASLFVKAKQNVPFLRYFIPFVNTPANIVKEAYQRTPFAALGGQMKADILAGGVKRDLALGKMTTGSMLMAYAAKLSMDGKVTGSGPADPALQKVWRSNNQPYSFKFQLDNGETRFISYNRLEPIGMLMGFSADFADIYHNLDDAELDEIVAAASLSLTNNLTSKTWLRGVTNAVDILDADSTESFSRIMRDTTSGFVPNAFNQFNGAFIDPVLRDPRGAKLDEDGNLANSQALAKMIDKAKQKAPGYSQDLPAQRGLWGQVIEPRGTFGDGVVESAINWLSPAYVKDVEGDAVNEMIIANNISVDRPKRIMKIPGFPMAVELTGEEYNRFIELAGQPAKAQLDRDIKDKRFAVLTDGEDGEKSNHVRKVIKQFRAQAKAQLLAEFPEIQERALDLEE